MMRKQSGQIQMVILDIDSMVPEDHLLRQIKNCVNFDFIYDFLFLVILNPPFLNIKFKPWYNTKVNSFLSIS